MNNTIYMKVDSVMKVFEIVELLEEGHNLLIDCDLSLQQKVVDYLSEVMYELKGQIVRITANQYLLRVDKGE